MNIHPGWRDVGVVEEPAPSAVPPFGDLLRSLISAKGMNRYTFSFSFGISASLVYSYCGGKDLPSLENLAKLCRTFPDHRDDLVDAALYAAELRGQSRQDSDQ